MQVRNSLRKMAESVIQGRRLAYYSRALNSDGTINVLMVSLSQHYLDNLGKDLYVTREVQSNKRPYHLKVHTSKNVLDVLEYMPEEFYVDFIIFVIDGGLGNCLHEIENNLTLIDSNFPREKFCIVSPESSYLKTMVSPSEIWEFAREHQINLINGQIQRPNGLFSLSKRILNMIEACCGLLNGIPMKNSV